MRINDILTDLRETKFLETGKGKVAGEKNKKDGADGYDGPIGAVGQKMPAPGNGK